MLELKLLGGAMLQGEDDALPGAATHRYSLAILALLASAPGQTLSRGKLVGLLWPDVPEKTARNRLATAVHRIRKALGVEVIQSVGGGLRLNDELVSSDVSRFRSALESGQPAVAVALYEGPFLDGFWLRGSPEFEHWAELERDRLELGYRESLEALAEAAGAEEPEVAARWWRQRARQDPYDTRVTMRLMEALESAGNRAAALRAFREHADLLEEELGSGPSDDVRALARRLRASPASSAEPLDEPGPATGLDRRSLAVLPFENLSATDEGGIFASGLHHDLLTRLSRIEELKVISRTSVLRYRGGDSSIPQIARELGVGTIVEGGVQHAAGRLRLNVQLIEVRGDMHRWAETYDYELTAGNIFDIQSELAGKIAQRLRAELTRHERARVNRRSTADLDAYLLYVQGRTYLARRTERGISRSLDYFQRAVEKEPGYASAWAGLAEALALMEWYGYPVSAAADPMEAARRSVELDPVLAEAHTSLGIVHAGRQHGPSAARAFERAAALEPSDAEAHNWLGWMQMILGRPAEGILPAERAAELDPMAPYTRVFLGLLYLTNGRVESALDEARIARELQPEFEIPHFVEGLALHHLGRLQEAAFAFEEGLTLVRARGTPSRSEVQATLAVARAAAGDASSARALLAAIRPSADPFAAGLVHAALGAPVQAFDAFESVRRWGPFATPVIRYLFPAELGPLRRDRRFEPLLHRVNRSWGLNPDGSVPSGQQG